MNDSLISRCGIYCGACYIYRAFKDRGSFLNVVSEKLKVPVDEIKCDGCLDPSENLWRNCRDCMIAVCIREKSIQFCYECSEFEKACDKYGELSKFCLQRDEDIRESLNRIKHGETEAWLKEQDAKWRCKACGKPISWYERKCHHCGQALLSH
jgi:hypothetical protein